jgi:PilZ domain
MGSMIFDKMNDKFPADHWLNEQKLPSKRSEIRRLVILKAYLHLVERNGHAHVVNLSRTGLRGVTDMPLSVGQKVFASLDDLTHCLGSVRWVDNRRFGLRFETALDMLPDYQQNEPGLLAGQRERQPRITTNLIAKIKLCGNPYLAKIRNISKSGMMVDTEMPLVAGQFLFLKLSNNKIVPAEVKWSEGSRSGVRLISPISILHFTYGDLQ